MKILIAVSRLFVGSLFIVSGLIKVNDPLGFSYKLEEYFSAEALNMPFFEPWALGIAVFVAVAEILLGFAMLTGGKSKLSSWLLLILILFFTWLTFYTATCDPTAPGVKCVTDCGCFGDALKDTIGRSLTPWESFCKDLVLLFFSLIIFIGQFSKKRFSLNTFSDDKVYIPVSIILVSVLSWFFSWWFPLGFTVVGFAGYLLIKSFFKSALHKEWIIAGWVFLISGLICWYAIDHLPIKDFRPYAEGKNIPEQMTLPEGAKPDVYETILTYKNMATEEIKDFTSENYPWNDSTWQWVNTQTKLIEEGDHAPIHDFGIYSMDEEDESDYAQDFLNEKVLFILVSYDISKACDKNQDRINAINEGAMNDGYYFIGLTSSLYNDVEDFRHRNANMFDYYNADQITLKTIIRSNPGLILMKNGIIYAKYHINDIPDYKDIKSDYLND